jgi:hypothetical protein
VYRDRGSSEKMYTGREKPKWGEITSETLILPCWTGTPGAPCVFWTTKYTQIGVMMREYRMRKYGKFVCYTWDECKQKYKKGAEIDTYRDSELQWDESGDKLENVWYSDGQNSGTDWGPDELPNPNDGPPPFFPLPIPVCTPFGCVPYPVPI